MGFRECAEEKWIKVVSSTECVDKNWGPMKCVNKNDVWPANMFVKALPNML